MAALDPRSFILISCLLGALCCVVLAILRRSLPPSISGVGQWALGLAFSVVGGVLVGLRDLIPEAVSIIAAYFFLTGSLALIYSSVRMFAGHGVQRGILATIVLAGALPLLWFTLYAPNPAMRITAAGIINCGLFLACAMEVHRLETRGAAEKFTAFMFAFMGIVCMARLISVATGYDHVTNILQPTLGQRLYQAAYSISLIALTMGFILMVGNKVHAMLSYLASRDALTGAYSRGAFFELLNQEIRRTQRTGSPMTLMMIDLDSFKQINDTWGHPVGDAVIADFIRIASSTLRKVDVLGRYGGDEFAVALPNTGAPEAAVVAERIRLLCAESAAAGRPNYTVSIGLCQSESGCETVDAFLALADTALYRAKNAGKNRVELGGKGLHVVPSALPAAVSAAVTA